MAFVDVDLGEQQELLADRIAFIELLNQERSLATREIVDALEHSRWTVIRARRV